MDLQSILPMFAGNNKELEKILPLLSGNREDVLKNLGTSSDPKTSTLLSMLKNNNSQKRYWGLNPIKEIANDEIFGRITKYFLSQKVSNKT